MTEEKEILVRYLLGELTEEIEERLERDYFLDQEKWHALRAVEDDLIHEYARGALSDRQRQQFEIAFLESPRNQERVELARMLMDRGARGAAPQASRRWPRWADWSGATPSQLTLAWSVALLLVAALATGMTRLVLNNKHLRAELLRARSTQLQQVQQEVPVAGGKTPAGIVIARALEPGLSRSPGSDNRPVMVPYSAVPVVYHFVLDLEQDDDTSYMATISTAEGKQLLVLTGLQSLPIPNGRIIHLQVPSDMLTIGDYCIRLQGASRRTHFRDLYPFVIR